MSTPPVDEYSSALESAVARLRSEGWDVAVNPDSSTIGLPNVEIDYLARRGDELVIGEIKYRDRSSSRELERLARRVATLGNARLELTWLGSKVTPRGEHELRRMAKSAEELVRINGPAAMLLAWAALEGALVKYFATKESLSDRKVKNARQRLAEMASQGELSDSQYERLSSAASMRNRIAHGELIQPPHDLVEYVVATAITFATGHHVSIDEMIDWFQSNYMDPADGVPYDSREGGYQYFAGGPFDADDVLSDQFDFMPKRDIEDAATQIEQDGALWVRRSDY